MATATRPTISIRGSHGTLRVDVATGVIVDAEHAPDPEPGYRDIVLCDPVSLAREYAAGFIETDILAIGYWLADGTFAEPLTMRQQDDGQGGMWFDDWVEMAYLPAPAIAA